MTKLAALIVAFALVAMASGCGAAAPEGVVQTDSGKVSGVVEDGVTVYRGIPYAAPPVEDLRWQPPQPPEPWSDVRACTTFGPECPQPVLGGKNSSASKQPQSEDCLYLNVWTPTKRPASGLPVMVWIHGGAYQLGRGSSPTYDGRKLAERGVIVVSLNYRLGPLGFLALPELSDESGHSASGNYGLMDQQAALRWVQSNIAAFGGDPARVTIFGQSAGAMSVCTQMTSPLSEGLFQQVISESSLYVDRGLLMHGTRPLAEAEDIGSEYARRVGCDDGPDRLKELREKPVAQLVSASLQEAPGTFISDCLFVPVVDGWVIPEEPGKVFAAGRQHDVPLLIGSNSEEGNLFTFAIHSSLETMTVPVYESKIREYFGSEGDRVLALYPVEKQSDIRQALSKVFTSFDFTGPARWTARRQVAIGQKAYLYQFDKTPLPPTAFLGPCHAAEIPFVFGTLVKGPSDNGAQSSMQSLTLQAFQRPLEESMVLTFAPDDVELSNQMIGYWTNFAIAGDPNGVDTAVAWPAYDPSTNQSIELGPKVKVVTDLQADACDLSDRFYGFGD